MVEIIETIDQVTVSTNGANGHAGDVGYNGFNGSPESKGEDGEKGHDGQNGQAGRDIQLWLQTNTLSPDIMASINNEPFIPFSPFGKASKSIYLEANGGDGGHGGHGGDGGNGGDGIHGKNAKNGFHATNGGNGGDGGNGGKGGHGGAGGNGGNIEILLDQEDIDLLALIQPPRNQAGHGGEGGQGGYGGVGGKAGRGGNFYLHFEKSAHKRNSTNTITYNAGRGGFAGKLGRIGDYGRAGKNGNPGSYHLEVLGLGRFTHIYGLEIGHSPIHSVDDVIEPGELLAIDMLDIFNYTQMQTPKNIAIGIRETEWIEPVGNKIWLVPSIKAQQTICFPKTLYFKVKYPSQISQSPLQVEAPLLFDIQLPRINRLMPNVKQANEKINICYPVRLSTVGHAYTISAEEEAPIIADVLNISSKDIILESYPTRAVKLKLAVKNGLAGEKVIFYDPILAQEFCLKEPFIQSFYSLPPGDVAFSGTLLFAKAAVSTQTDVEFSLSLSLGNLAGTADEIIQEREFKVQLAERYVFNADADFVLVTNRKTSSETIAAWQASINKLNASMCTWNTSLYHGFSFTRKNQDDDESLISTLSGKVVIILNNYFSDTNGTTLTSSSYLNNKELFKAAKFGNISTYIVGEEINMADELAMDQIASVERNESYEAYYQTITCKSRHFWPAGPKERELSEEAEETFQKLRCDRPKEPVCIVYDYNPEKIKSTLYSEWSIGNIEIRPLLDLDHPYIASREKNPSTVDETDIYNVIKLLPFAKKLNYLFQSVDNEETNAICFAAILSDLQDEVKLFSLERCKQAVSHDVLMRNMQSLEKLVTYNFNFANLSTAFKNKLLDLLEVYKNGVDAQLEGRFGYLIAAHQLRKSFTEIVFPKVEGLIARITEHSAINQPPRLVTHFFKPAIKPRPTQFNTEIPIETIQKSTNLKPKPPTVDNAHRFFVRPRGVLNTQAERLARIKECHSQCSFEIG